MESTVTWQDFLLPEEPSLKGFFFFCALYDEVCERGKNLSRTGLLQILWSMVLFCKHHQVANYAVSNVQGDLYVTACSSE